jgi:hypothetical protein
MGTRGVSTESRALVVADGQVAPASPRNNAPVIVGASRAVSVREHSQSAPVVRVDNQLQRKIAEERGAAYLAAQATQDTAALYGMGEMLQDRFADLVLTLRDQYVNEETWGIPGDDAAAVPSRWSIANARAIKAVQGLSDDIEFLRGQYVTRAGEVIAQPLDTRDERHPVIRFLDPDGDWFSER